MLSFYFISKRCFSPAFFFPEWLLFYNLCQDFIFGWEISVTAGIYVFWHATLPASVSSEFTLFPTLLFPFSFPLCDSMEIFL